jgi:hypothetical protein
MIGQIIPSTVWERKRLGKFTSSEITKLLTPGKRDMTPEELAARPKKGKGSATTQVEDYSILSKGALTYIREKESEIGTGTIRVMESYATDWGKSQEPHAAEALAKLYPGLKYYGITDQQFFPYTFCSGGSPDAEHDQTRVFEVKCPENPANHLEYRDSLTAEDLKENHLDHYAQLQMNMAIVAKKNGFPFSEMEGVFASYDPRYPEHIQLHTIICPPDFDLLEKINAAIEAAESELAERVDRDKLQL